MLMISLGIYLDLEHKGDHTSRDSLALFRERKCRQQPIISFVSDHRWEQPCAGGFRRSRLSGRFLKTGLESTLKMTTVKRLPLQSEHGYFAQSSISHTAACSLMDTSFSRGGNNTWLHLWEEDWFWLTQALCLLCHEQVAGWLIEWPASHRKALAPSPKLLH